MLVAYGVGAALQIISNSNNEKPTLAHMSRATDVIHLYQRYNTRNLTRMPSVDVTTNSLSTLHAIEVLALNDHLFPEAQGFPSVNKSMNFLLQVRRLDSTLCMYMCISTLHTYDSHYFFLCCALHVSDEFILLLLLIMSNRKSVMLWRMVALIPDRKCHYNRWLCIPDYIS